MQPTAATAAATAESNEQAHASLYLTTGGCRFALAFVVTGGGREHIRFAAAAAVVASGVGNIIPAHVSATTGPHRLHR